jgi:CheY-like chemotaxis protein
MATYVLRAEEATAAPTKLPDRRRCSIAAAPARIYGGPTVWPEKTSEQGPADSAAPARRSPSEGSPERTAERATPSGGERILIVDDEIAVRAIVGRVLAHAGYQVEQAGDGPEAIELYRKRGPYALVLLDESMPGMPGRRVLDELLAIDARAKVVLFTGNGAEGECPPRAAGVLEKPVAMDALIEYLGRVLRAP